MVVSQIALEVRLSVRLGVMLNIRSTSGVLDFSGLNKAICSIVI